MDKQIKTHNALVIAKAKALGPRKIYAGLLWWQRENEYKRGWVFYSFCWFHDNKKPAPQSAVEPEEPSNELREAIGIMQTRRRQKRKREQLKQSLASRSACRDGVAHGT